MSKKGSTHVDWAISMGIFLTYILTMFILIQPGIEPIQKNDQLIEGANAKIENAYKSIEEANNKLKAHAEGRRG